MAEVVGVYGGCFDPFHRGHALIAQAAVGALRLNRLLVVPTARPRGKQAHASLADRHAICAAALASISGCELHEDVAVAEGESRTINLLRSLQDEQRRLVFIVGSDAFAVFTSWWQWREVLELASWAVVPRAGAGAAWHPADEEFDRRVVAQADDLLAEAGRLWRWNLEVPELSAMQLRARIAAGEEGWEEDLPPAAAAVVKERGLYRSSS